jgi:hypothetical protein
MNRSYSKIRHIQEANSRLEKRILSEQKTGCMKGDCKNGSGTYKLKDGTEYVGQFKNSEFDGQGTYKWSDGAVYVGQFKNSEFDGQGVLKNTKGGVYRGQFKDDKRNGQGTYINSKGVKFSGVWVDGKLDGKTTTDLEKVTESNQTKTGCIQGDCVNGTGTYKWETGTEYTGQFKDGRINGQGTETFADGSVYVGEFKDNKPNGKGTYTNINGVKFSGTWVMDKLDGHSTKDLDKVTKNKTECTQPTEPTHRYKDDKNYRYAKSGDCWWAKNINNNKWFNLTELVKTKPNIQISIDKLNDGTNLIKL